MTNAAQPLPSDDNGHQETAPPPRVLSRHRDSGIALTAAITLALYLLSAGPVITYYVKNAATTKSTWHYRMAENFYTPLHCTLNAIPGSRKVFMRYIEYCYNNINISTITIAPPASGRTPASGSSATP